MRIIYKIKIKLLFKKKGIWKHTTQLLLLSIMNHYDISGYFEEKMTLKGYNLNLSLFFLDIPCKILYHILYVSYQDIS